MDSSTVSIGWRMSSWVAKATRLQSGKMLFPNLTVPADGIFLPATMFSSVVFPDPEGPRMAVNWEIVTCPDAGCRMVRLPA